MAKALKLGMRVRVSKEFRDNPIGVNLAGRIGVIRAVDPLDPSFPGIMFSRMTKGHDLDGRGTNQGKRGGWYIRSAYLTPVDVKHNGKTYRVVRKGKK